MLELFRRSELCKYHLLQNKTRMVIFFSTYNSEMQYMTREQLNPDGQ